MWKIAKGSDKLWGLKLKIINNNVAEFSAFLAFKTIFYLLEEL